MRNLASILTLSIVCFVAMAAASSDPHKDAVVRYFDLRERTLSSRGTPSDVDKLLALLTDDAQIEHPGPSVVMTKAEAREGMIAHLREGGDAKYRIRNAHFDHDYATVEFTLTYNVNGKSQSRAGVEIFNFNQDKISRVVVYTDAFVKK